MPEWAVGEWQNPPQSVLLAESGTDSAVLARQGNFFVLATRSSSGPEWFLLSGNPTEDFIQSSIGTELIGKGQVAEVTAITDQGEFDRPIVTDGHLPTQVSCNPVKVFDDRPGSVELSVEFVEELFEDKYVLPTFTVGEETIPLWSLKTTGIAAARSLVDTATNELSDTTQRIAIGWEVTDSWQVGGETIEVSYSISPGQTQGLIECYATREQLQEVTIDRSGHTVGSSKTCPYCDTSTCVKCLDPVETCPICLLAICGQCVQPASWGNRRQVCEACSRLRSANLVVKWRNRDRLTRASATLLSWGRDHVHEVLIVDINGDRAALVDDAEPVPLSAEGERLLTANLRGFASG